MNLPGPAGHPPGPHLLDIVIHETHGQETASRSTREENSRDTARLARADNHDAFLQTLRQGNDRKSESPDRNED